jgi:hypothetical protein
METFKNVAKAVLITAVLGGGAADARTITIATDHSRSNPLLSDPMFAASAAHYAAQLVLGLEEGDEVHIRSFGARGEAPNLLDKPIVLNRRQRAPVVAQVVSTYIAGLPERAGEAQDSTNIVSFIELGGLNCKDGDQVLLLTDGLEASEYVSPQAFIEGKAHLPAPDPQLSLKGCEVIFYGLGAGLPGSAAKFMRNEWSSFISAAGGAFTPVIK